jgi:hypothetical protein
MYTRTNLDALASCLAKEPLFNAKGKPIAPARLRVIARRVVRELWRLGYSLEARRIGSSEPPAGADDPKTWRGARRSAPEKPRADETIDLESMLEERGGTP